MSQKSNLGVSAGFRRRVSSLWRLPLGIALMPVLLLGVKPLAVRAFGERLYRQVDLEIERMAQLKEQTLQKKVFIMGDSTGVFDVDTNEFQSAVNLSMADATAVQIYFLLKRALAQGPPPNCLLLAPSFQWKDHYDYLWREYAARDFFSESELEEFYRESARLGEPPGSYGRLAYLALRLISREGFYDANSLSRLQDALFHWKSNMLRVTSQREALARNHGSVAVTSAAAYERPITRFYESDPAMTETEESFFRRFLSLVKQNKIRLFVLKVPFSEIVPLEQAGPYWRKYDALLEKNLRESGVSAGMIAPPPFPDDLYITTGHLLLPGVRRLSPMIQSAMKGCQANGSPP